MENNILNIVKDLYSYNCFVNQMEAKYGFSDLWFDMEILNSIALNDWETSGRPYIWEAWKEKYQNDAEKLVISFLYKYQIEYS